MQEPSDEVNAHNRAMALSIADVVRELVDLLGATTVAAIAGVKETRAVQQWMNGREPQRPHVLRFALQLALIITDAKQKSTAQAWFNGSNPGLEGQSPLVFFRTRPLDEIQGRLLAAARVFAARRR